MGVYEKNVLHTRNKYKKGNTERSHLDTSPACYAVGWIQKHLCSTDLGFLNGVGTLKCMAIPYASLSPGSSKSGHVAVLPMPKTMCFFQEPKWGIKKLSIEGAKCYVTLSHNQDQMRRECQKTPHLKLTIFLEKPPSSQCSQSLETIVYYFLKCRCILYSLTNTCCR